MNKDIIPTNAKGQAHGYWERYNGKGKLWYKCVFINGKLNGFDEDYCYDYGKLTEKTYHI